jgi:hypothetical protein
MVIVDEAHHARVRIRGNRREETQLYKLVRDLVSHDASSKRAALFLTATPMQLDPRELYSLIELLDPALFPTVEHFERHRSQERVLSRLVQELTEQGIWLPGTELDVLGEQVGSWLGSDPVIVKQRLLAGRDSVARVCMELSAKHLLSGVLIRNRKKVVGRFMPRQADRWEVHLSPEEKRALDQVETFVRDRLAKANRTNDQAVGFIMVIFQKLMASSIHALRLSLDRRRERLEQPAAVPSLNKRTFAAIADVQDRLDQDALVSTLLGEIAVADAEAGRLKRLVQMLDAVPTDSKADTLVAQLAELWQHDPTAKVLLFTAFRETQEYLRRRLAAIGWDVYLFHGQMEPIAKDAAVDGFRTSAQSSILLSTEPGGEGRNFQFCHLLVNYDLPWNPMLVEQRISRVDRIGQTNTVQVFNFWVRGSFEEQVLNVLERHVNVFEEPVGGLDPILSDAERDLIKILQIPPGERGRALHRFEEQLESRLYAARAEEKKFSDFIIETKSYSKEIVLQLSKQAAPVDAGDHELFITHLLADVNTHLHRNQDGTYEVTFHEPFVSEYPEHCTDPSRHRLAALRPDVKPDSEHVEYFALGHPVVDDLIARVTNPSYSGSAAAFEIDATKEMPQGGGWLIVYDLVHDLGVPALKELRELAPVFVHDSGEVDTHLGQRLLNRARSFANDHNLAPADIPTETLNSALSVAQTAGFARLHELETDAQEKSERQLGRQRTELLAYFDYRDQAARDRLESSEQVLAQHKAVDSAEMGKIIPVLRANVTRSQRLIEQLAAERLDRLAQLERRVDGSSDLRLVAIARVKIVESDTAHGC